MSSATLPAISQAPVARITLRGNGTQSGTINYAGDVDYFVFVSAVASRVPDLAAHLVSSMGFRPDVQLLDVVGAGCDAGLKGMQPVANFGAQNPGKVGLLLCVESCWARDEFDLAAMPTMSSSTCACWAAASLSMRL